MDFPSPGGADGARAWVGLAGGSGKGGRPRPSEVVQLQQSLVQHLMDVDIFLFGTGQVFCKQKAGGGAGGHPVTRSHPEHPWGTGRTTRTCVGKHQEGFSPVALPLQPGRLFQCKPPPLRQVAWPIGSAEHDQASKDTGLLAADTEEEDHAEQQ